MLKFCNDVFFSYIVQGNHGMILSVVLKSFISCRLMLMFILVFLYLNVDVHCSVQFIFKVI